MEVKQYFGEECDVACLLTTDYCGIKLAPSYKVFCVKVVVS
jgi:hypothetical protein